MCLYIYIYVYLYHYCFGSIFITISIIRSMNNSIVVTTKVFVWILRFRMLSGFQGLVIWFGSSHEGQALQALGAASCGSGI